MLRRNKFLRILKSFFVVSLVLASFVFIACEEDDDIEVKKQDVKIVISGLENEESILKGTITTFTIDVDKSESVDLVSVMLNGSLLDSFDSFPSDFEWNTSELDVGEYKIRFAAIFNGVEVGYKEFSINLTTPVTGTVTDYDGNIYNTIQIGTQIWMVENLKTTHYRNGDALSCITTSDNWDGLTAGGYCNYDNSASNGETYGHLYNFYAVEDSRELCPEGWHVPTKDDFKILIKYLGGADVAGGKMKEAGSEHWTSTLISSVNEGTNESGFTALPGGVLDASGNFSSEGYMAWFWTSEGYDSSISGKRYGYRRTLDLRSEEVSDERGYHAYMGMSVRCIKD
jgi:uncharacterized protein (TIGR02145 family)